MAIYLKEEKELTVPDQSKPSCGCIHPYSVLILIVKTNGPLTFSLLCRTSNIPVQPQISVPAFAGASTPILRSVPWTSNQALLRCQPVLVVVQQLVQ